MIVKENCADPKTLLFVLEVLQYSILFFPNFILRIIVTKHTTIFVFSEQRRFSEPEYVTFFFWMMMNFNFFPKSAFSHVRQELSVHSWPTRFGDSSLFANENRRSTQLLHRPTLGKAYFNHLKATRLIGPSARSRIIAISQSFRISPLFYKAQTFHNEPWLQDKGMCLLSTKGMDFHHKFPSKNIRINLKNIQG